VRTTIHVLTAAKYLYLQHAFDDCAAFQSLSSCKVLYHDATANWCTDTQHVKERSQVKQESLANANVKRATAVPI